MVFIYLTLQDDMVLNILIDPSCNLDAKECFGFHDQCALEIKSLEGTFLLK